jgi:ABC-type Mn2+/Zn2+ transport system ATPase subunit
VTSPPPIEARDLSAGYAGSSSLALRDVNFAAAAGERVGVLGPNGGGKSTLFRVLLGELRAARGSVKAPARCGVVPQTERSRLDYPVSALDVALMGTLSRLPWWRRPGREEREQALDALEVVGLRDRSRASFGELSGGQRQRVLVARALVQDSPVLLLDEPFAGVDAPNAERLMALIDRFADEGRTVLIATHDVEQARAWDQVLCLNGSQIAFGVPAQTLTRSVLEATYGAAIVTLPAGPDGAERGVLAPHHHDH